MVWLLLATAGQFLNAVVAILDKYIVSDKQMLPRPFVYAFYSCLLTSAWVLVYFLGFLPIPDFFQVPSYKNVTHPTLVVVGLAFLAAYTFFMGLVSMYDALRQADASDVMPVIGAVSALASFALNYYFLDGGLSSNFILGVVLLSFGTFLVSRARFVFPIVLLTIHSGVFFAFHYITMKGLFNETHFDNAFFWSRIGFVVFSLSLLMVPAYLEKIINQSTHTSVRAGALVVFAKVMGGIAAFMLLKATDWGEVTVVQALDGLKFVFILMIGWFLSHFFKHPAGEQIDEPRALLHKVVYVLIIVIGFVVLFL